MAHHKDQVECDGGGQFPEKQGETQQMTKQPTRKLAVVKTARLCLQRFRFGRSGVGPRI